MKWMDLPPVWLVFFLVVTWFSPWDLVMPGGFIFGLICLGVAAGLTLAALIVFRRHRTTVVPHREPSAIISTGVFRYTRNPIYLADLLILVGFSLIWGKLLGLMLLPVFFWILLERFIRGEEARLRAAFPDKFEAYQRATRRWL